MPTTAQYLPSSTTDFADGWLNDANIKTTSDDYASATVSRELDYPNGYLETPTPPLRGYGFTGIDTGMALGDTLNGVEYEIRARCTRSDVDVYLYAYGSHNYTNPERVKLSSVMTTYTLGGPDNITGTNYQSIESLGIAVCPSMYGLMTSGTGSATVEIAYVKMRAYWTATKPAAMAFTAQTNVTPGEWVYSNPISVSGMPTSHVLPVTFYGQELFYSGSLVASEIEKNNDGKWLLNYVGSAVNGDTFRVRRFHAYASLYDENPLPISFNGYEVLFSTTTTVPDRTPTVTPFEPQASAPPATWIRLATIKLTDFNALPYGESPSDVTDGMFAMMAADPAKIRNTYYYPESVIKPSGMAASVSEVRDGTYTWDVYPGTEMVVDFLTGTTPGEVYPVSLLAGTLNPYVNVTTENRVNPAHATTPIGTLATNTEVTSQPFTVSGIDGDQAITFSSIGGTLHKFIRNAETWYLIGAYTVKNGDTITLRMTTPAVGSQSCNVTAKIGTMHVNFCCGSVGADITPDAFSFTSQTGLLPAALATSNTITLAGLTAAQPIIATVSPGFEISINGGAFTAGSASCVNGNTVAVRGYSSHLPGVSNVATVTIGGTSATFTITTRNATPAWD